MIGGVILSLPAFRKWPEKNYKFSVPNSKLYISRVQIVKNKACQMMKIAAKLSKFPLKFSLKAFPVLGHASVTV